MWRAQRQQPAPARSTSGARWSLFVSVDDGMQTLADTIVARLPPGALRCGAPVAKVTPAAAGWTVQCADGTRHSADAVLLATPAHRSAAFLRDTDETLARELAAIPYASSATVSLAYPLSAFPHGIGGFGFVVPLVEARSIVACTYSSIKYPGRAPEGFVLLRAFVGGAVQPERFADDDATMLGLVRDELKALLGVRGDPVLTRLHRHPGAMPQYHVGHLDRMARVDSRLAAIPGLGLAGSAYRGVGIPDCIHSGEQAAETLLGRLPPEALTP